MSFNPNGLGTLRPETQALHAGQVPDPTTNARAVPIYATTSYVFDDAAHAARLFGLQEFGNIYTRIMNPTTGVFEERVAALEGGVAALASRPGRPPRRWRSSTSPAPARTSCRSSSLYGGTYNLFHYTLPKLGITVKFVDGVATPRTTRPPSTTTRAPSTSRPSATPGSTSPTSRASPTSPTRHGVPLIVDNTFAPLLAQPIELGADIVIHSATKWIGGHGTVIGGVVVDGGKFDWAASSPLPRGLRRPGPAYHGVSYTRGLRPPGVHPQAPRPGPPGPRRRAQPVQRLAAIQGLETLPLRIERHSQNALAVAQWLQDRPEVEWVSYPGLASHASYEIANAGPQAAASAASSPSASRAARTPAGRSSTA